MAEHTPLDVDAIAARADAATPGPWYWDTDGEGGTVFSGPRFDGTEEQGEEE